VFSADLNHADAVKLFYSSFPNAAGIREVLRAKGACDIHVKKGARMVTYEVDENFNEKVMQWVSPRVGMRAMQIVLADDRNEALKLLIDISNSDDRSTFGVAFESWAHLQLARASVSASSQSAVEGEGELLAS
jgi:hypothetical protein